MSNIWVVSSKTLTCHVPPDYMRERLERAGLRSIDAAVDVTNTRLVNLCTPLTLIG